MEDVEDGFGLNNFKISVFFFMYVVYGNGVKIEVLG